MFSRWMFAVLAPLALAVTLGAFGDVLSRATQPGDPARRVAHHFTSIDDPSCAAIGAKHL